MSQVTLLFASLETAAWRVAAVPAVARAVRELAQAGVSTCTVVTPTGGKVPEFVTREIQRLAPGIVVTFAQTGEVPTSPGPVFAGEAIAPAAQIQARLNDGFTTEKSFSTSAPLSSMAAIAMLRQREREIYAGAGKPGDGVIARYLNRPISRVITRVFLSIAPVTPNQATIGTALIALAMVCALIFLPGYQGQLWGAILFHAASVFDGVDGEIARATFRSSQLGATIDSLVDFATNILFFGCLVYNLHVAGDEREALIALVGLSGLGLGKFFLGSVATAKKQPVTFNAVKDHFAHRPTLLKQWLTWLTMRDFYAFAAVVLIASGFGNIGVYLFTTVVAGWLTVVVLTTRRMQMRIRNHSQNEPDQRNSSVGIEKQRPVVRT